MTNRKGTLILCLAICLLMVACDNKEKSASNEQDTIRHGEDSLLAELNRLGFQRFNDSAKWRMFLLYIDDTAKLQPGQKVTQELPLGFLKLKLSYWENKGDTLSLLYRFSYNDSVIIQDGKKGMLASGIQFNTKADSILGYVMGDGIYNQRGPGSRFETPLQPEVIEFMNSNKEKLDPWLKAEAVRRGILK